MCMQFYCYDIYAIKYTEKKKINICKRNCLRMKQKTIHLAGLVFSWWIILSDPRLSTVSGVCRSWWQNEINSPSKGTARTLWGWHGSERSRLELTSLFWVTESDVRRTGFEPWLYVPSSVTCDKQLCLWNYSLSFTGLLWGLWEGSQGTQCPAPSSLSGNNNGHYWLCQGARSCQTFWSAS